MESSKIYCQDCKHFSSGIQIVYGEKRFAYWCNAKKNVICCEHRTAYPMWGKKSDSCPHYERRRKKWYQFWINGIYNF